MADPSNCGAALIAEARRRLIDESLPRLRTCLEHLSEEDLWLRPNDRTVSPGNMILHLCGNVRQWILSGLGGMPDNRRRDDEFNEPGPLPKADLLERLETTMDQTREALADLDPDDLCHARTVQGFEESGVSILVHVIEHFSYHVGQISYIVKSGKAVDLNYYGGVDLNKTGGN